MATMREYRRRQANKRLQNTIEQQGSPGLDLGEHPLTIWLITAVVIVWLYIRRSNLGIDLHPMEKSPAIKQPSAKPSPKVSIPVLPSAGVDWSGSLPRM